MIKWLGNWDDFIRFRFSLQPQNPGWRTGAGTAAASGSTGKLRKRLHPGYNMETRLNIPQFLLQNHQKINPLAIKIMDKVKRTRQNFNNMRPSFKHPLKRY